MRIGGSVHTQSDVSALQLLSRPPSGTGVFSATASGTASAAPLVQAVGQSRTASPFVTYSSNGALSSDASAAAQIKAMAATGTFRNAAKGVADDEVRTLVRDGRIATLPALNDAQLSRMSKEERNVYGVVRGLQSLFEAQPKSPEQALEDHRNIVLQSYPDEIERQRGRLASQSDPAEKAVTQEIIDRYQGELTAARQGTMKIDKVADTALVKDTGDFTVSDNGNGWNASGSRIEADIPALRQAYGTKNLLPGSSAYFGGYVISW